MAYNRFLIFIFVIIFFVIVCIRIFIFFLIIFVIFTVIIIVIIVFFTIIFIAVLFFYSTSLTLIVIAALPVYILIATLIRPILREQLGPDARKVPRRGVPNVLVRAMALFDPGVRSVVGELGQKTTYSLENARRRVGWAPRPIEETIVDCARSLLGQTPPTAAASAA